MTHGGGWVPAVTYINPAFTYATVPRLIEGTRYEFRVRAENLQGLSEPLTTAEPIIAKNQFGMCCVNTILNIPMIYFVFNQQFI